MDTTYPPNGGLAECPRLIQSNQDFRSWINFSEALDTTYPPNGGLADCPRLNQSILLLYKLLTPTPHPGGPRWALALGTRLMGQRGSQRGIIQLSGSLCFRLNIVKPWTQPILRMEDWLNVQD